MSRKADNIVDAIENAPSYAVRPSLRLGEMDFYPLTGRCKGTELDLPQFAGCAGYDRDFNQTPKAPFVYRGAYAGEDSKPGWRLSEQPKTPRR